MSNEKITSFGGSFLIADFIKNLGLEERLDSSLTKAINEVFLLKLLYNYNSTYKHTSNS
jgi:hypothetical protein